MLEVSLGWRFHILIKEHGKNIHQIMLTTFFQMSSNVSTPSSTFLRHLSISPEKKRIIWVLFCFLNKMHVCLLTFNQNQLSTPLTFWETCCFLVFESHIYYMCVCVSAIESSEMSTLNLSCSLNLAFSLKSNAVMRVY